MNRLISAAMRSPLWIASAATLVVLPLVMLGAFRNQAQGTPPGGESRDRIVIGSTALVPDNLGINHLVATWALVTPEDDIEEVGVTIPVALFDNQPTERGTGPAGAIASLAFPRLVQEQTFFNHFELQSKPEGHVAPPGSVNPDRNRVPHYDFHFYAVPEDVVWEIPLVRPPSPALPAVPAERLPQGYIQPGFSQLQMDRHSSPAWSLFDTDPLSTIMLAGFPPAVEGLPDPTQMHFIQPMVSREFLLERNDFELPVPMPKEFGRPMRYPTRFVAEYDADLDAYHFVYSEFVPVE
jgi:hypothetical protein